MSEYKKYQLQWMISHGYSLRALIAELTEMQFGDPEDEDVPPFGQPRHAGTDKQLHPGGQLAAVEGEGEGFRHHAGDSYVAHPHHRLGMPMAVAEVLPRHQKVPRSGLLQKIRLILLHQAADNFLRLL